MTCNAASPYEQSSSPDKARWRPRACSAVEEHRAQRDAKDSILHWCIYMKFAVSGEKAAGQSFPLQRAHLLNTLSFAQQQQLKWSQFPPPDFLKALQNLWLGVQWVKGRGSKRYNALIHGQACSDRQPRELLWTHVSHCCLYALLNHLSCSKLQLKRFICIQQLSHCMCH